MDVTKLCRCGEIKYKTEGKCRFCYLEDRIDSHERILEKTLEMLKLARNRLEALEK